MSPELSIPRAELAAFCRANGIRRLSIFGSAVRDDFGPESDVDLLVVMPDGTDRREAAVAMRVALSGMLPATDIVVTTPDEIERRGHIKGTVLREAMREGRVVHDRL